MYSVIDCILLYTYSKPEKTFDNKSRCMLPKKLAHQAIRLTKKLAKKEGGLSNNLFTIVHGKHDDANFKSVHHVFKNYGCFSKCL